MLQLNFFPFQEAKVDELEAQLQNAQADLKSAQKRIEQLHGALKDHEEEFSGDEQYSRSIDDSLGDGISFEDSYSLGDDDDDDSLDLSEDEDDDIVMPRSSARGVNKTKLSKELSPALEKKDLSPATSRKNRKSIPKDRSEEEDEFEASRKARQRRLKELEEEEAELEAARKARQERMKAINDVEEDVKPARKAKTKDYDRDQKEEKLEAKTSSFKRDKKPYDDEEDEDEDDADLEEFLLKQRERMKKMADSDDDDDVGMSTIKSSRGASSRISSDTLSSVADRGGQLHVANGKSNGVGSSRKSQSREQSEEPNASSQSRRESVEDGEGHIASRYRRKRQRRRTIEQLTSPEHTSKANGVDL